MRSFIRLFSNNYLSHLEDKLQNKPVENKQRRFEAERKGRVSEGKVTITSIDCPGPFRYILVLIYPHPANPRLGDALSYWNLS